MTRQYWQNHQRHEGLITSNSHVAALLIRNFMDPELPMEHYEPYRRWKQWLAKQPTIQISNRHDPLSFSVNS